jgi:RHS repeat-associated protein
VTFRVLRIALELLLPVAVSSTAQAYDRDSKGRIVAIRTKANAATAAWTNVASGMAYEPFASLKSATLGNTLTMANSWGNDGRLAFRRLKTNTGKNQSLLSYSYDNDDNITRITDGVNGANSLNYGYDVRGRLSMIEQSGSGQIVYNRQDYLHDANGNRTALERRFVKDQVSADATETYTLTPGTNRLSSISDDAGTRSIQYDARGNMQSESRTGNVSITVTALYDGHARLISLARTGEDTQANVYNGMDQRVVVTSGTVTRRFVYDPDGRVLGEYGTSASDVIAERIWMTPEVAGSGLFGGDDGTGGYAPIAIVTGNTLSWVHANHLGVPQLYTDANGAAVATPVYTLPGFPGQFRTFADIYYNQYRDYDTSTGRYLQADPIGLAGGPSPYSYAMGNPVRHMDPTGEFVPAVIVAGLLIGSGSEFVIQLGSNLWNGRNVFDRDCYDLGEIALAGGLGALGGGLGTLRTLRFASRSRTWETGFEWSHFIPRKIVDLLPRGKLRGALNKRGGLNGRWVTPQQHYRHDPFRYPSGWRDMPDRYRHSWQRNFDRAPAWLKGLGAGAGLGAGLGEGDGE